jgi:hypothetical protein
MKTKDSRTRRFDAREFLSIFEHRRVAAGARALCCASVLAILAGCDGGSRSRDREPAPAPPPPPPVQEEPTRATATEVGTPLGPAVTRTISAAGGVVETVDGSLRIDIPAGALASEQVVSIQPVSNHAHGNVGGAYRLGPEDISFASPVRLTFRFTPEQVLGTAPQLLRVASQTRDGFWELHEAVTLDTDERTVSIDAAHFSDWSLVTGTLLSPQAATVRPSETVSLTVVVCERVADDDLLAPLVAECRTSEVFRNLVRNWSVNGTPGGDGNVGTVAVQEDRSALYTAPAVAPNANPVAVSAEYTTLEGGLVTLVSNIRVQSGLCTPPNAVEPCRFELVQFDGEGLPFTGLPRESWQNPETVVSGRLSIWDFDGDGSGTWSLRIVWVEARPSGDLEQFEQLAGDFVSDANGTLRFTILGSEASFTGRIQNDAVAIADYPFTTKNASVLAQLRFRQE